MKVKFVINQKNKEIMGIAYDENKSHSNTLNLFRLIVNYSFNHMFVSK